MQCSANSLHILQAIQFFCYDLHITAEIFFGTILFPCSLITKIHDFFFLKKVLHVYMQESGTFLVCGMKVIFVCYMMSSFRSSMFVHFGASLDLVMEILALFYY